MKQKHLIYLGLILSSLNNYAQEQSQDFLLVSPASRPNKIYHGFSTILNVCQPTPPGDYIWETDNGTISIGEKDATYHSANPGKTTIRVKKLTKSGDTVLVHERRLVVHPHLPIKVYLHGKNSGTIDRKGLQLLDGIGTRYNDIELQAGIKIHKYKLIVVRNKEVLANTDVSPSTNYFPAEVKEVFSKVQAGDVLIFTNFEVGPPQGDETFSAEPLVFTVS